MEELFDIRHAGLVKSQRFTDHYDRVSNAIRRYLGDRYGFDGLECTTRETLALLRDVRPQIAVMPHISGFLRQADLVKFARLTPTAAECTQALELGEEIVQRTVPAPGERTLVPGAEPPEDDADDASAEGDSAPKPPRAGEDSGRQPVSPAQPATAPEPVDSLRPVSSPKAEPATVEPPVDDPTPSESHSEPPAGGKR
jgi:hypothetical protein